MRSETVDHDLLIARDLKSGQERVITDLRGDGSSGWKIHGYALSPDRKRIVLASLYGPTKADVDTGLATRAIWSLATDGSDFRRLTPVFPNTSQGRSQFSIPVGEPVFTKDGSVLYDFGNYWYEGTTLKGGSLPWSVSAGGGTPTLLSTVTSCSVLDPSVHPVTGELLFRHSVCISSQDEGIFLYPSAGGTAPKKLVAQTYGPGGIDPSLETASWIGDGSGFVFVGTTEVTRAGQTDTARALFVYDMVKATATPIVVPDAGFYVQTGAISADGQALVYCLRGAGDTYNLHFIDLSAATPVDKALTTDGKSCAPQF